MLGIPSGNLSRRRPGWRFLHHGLQTAQTRSAEMFTGRDAHMYQQETSCDHPEE